MARSGKFGRDGLEEDHGADGDDVRQVVTGNRAGRSGFARRYARGLALSTGKVREALDGDGIVLRDELRRIDAAVVSEAKDLGVVVYYHMMQGDLRYNEASDVAGGIAHAMCGVRSLFHVDAEGWPVWSPDEATDGVKVDV